MRFMKATAAALALAVAAVSFTGTAEARYRNYHHHHDGGDALAAGIFGFAAGAILSGALSQPRYYEPAPYYYEPEPVYEAPPAPVYYQQPVQAYYAAPEPWSPEWYDYCHARFRSFDARTGYFLGHDGQYHFCQ